MPLATLGQETRWAYSTTPPSPHGAIGLKKEIRIYSYINNSVLFPWQNADVTAVYNTCSAKICLFMFMSEFWFWRFSQTFLISVSVQSLIIYLFVIFKKNHVSVRMNRPSFTIKHICHRPKCFTLVIPCYNFCVTQINKKKFVVGVWKKIVQLFRLCTHTDVVTKQKF